MGMEEQYRNREIDRIFGEIRDMFNEHRADDRKDFGEVKITLLELTKQVSKTNGRVKALELWRMFILGALAVIGFFVTPELVTKILNL